ncbi:MAG TPA: glycosyl hydrolase [Opitutus sp.]|nr:glycosyl hydrolase [Opitutus sp.]
MKQPAIAFRLQPETVANARRFGRWRVWVKATLAIVLGAWSAPVGQAAAPESPRFDLRAEPQTLFRAKWLQDRRHILQSFAFDDAGGHVYVLQVEGSNAGGTFAEHSRRGDLILTKLSRDGARIEGHMTLRGFGHGVAMGIEREGDEVFVWTEVDSEPNAAGVGRGTRIGRFRFIDGMTLETTSPAIEKFTPESGARACTPSLDLAHGRLAVRYVSASGSWKIALYDLAAFNAGGAKPLREISLRQDFGVFQGWCTFGDWLYVYSGTAYSDDNPPPGNATLFVLDWRSGSVVDQAHTNAFADLVYREPEGVAVQIAAGKPRLCFGFGASVSATDSRRQASIAYIDRLHGSGDRPDRMSGGTTAAPAEELVAGFARPPDAAKPATMWWWFNSNVNHAGITRDLEQFRAKGIGGVVLINSTTGFGTGPIPQGPKFLSREWRELYRHALAEAHRLGLEVGVNLSTGWCMGGPWIKPENSGRWFLQSSVVVEGPAKFSEVLPLPGNKTGYENARQLFIKNYVNLPLAELDYRDSSVIAFPEPEPAGTQLGAARSALLPAKSNRLDASSHARAHEVMDPTLIPWSASPADAPVPAKGVIDVTSKLGADGRLEWDVPAGRWVILRTGHRMTGARTAYALPEGEGLEVDWLDEAGVEAQFEHLGRILLEEAGPLAGGTLKYFHEDSFEDGFPNWTVTFLEKFKHYRGYDPTPYLPVFAGRLVESAEVSDRFLYDYRRTVADCMADAHYGRFAELSHEHGLEVQNESAGPSWSGTMCMDTLKNLGRSDRPMGEFWQDNYRFVQDGQNQVTKMVATAAHVYGKKTASAEAFTTFAHWSDDPAALKPMADRAFCEGINRLVFHTSTATRPEDGKPGYEYGAGTHFNPNLTWWEQSGAFLDYLGRCQHLLQAGVFVADVLYYNGDWAPNIVPPKHVPPDLGPGYDYDVCNTEVLLTRLAVKGGRLVLPDGMSYRALVLPESETMPVEVARRLRELVAAGATVVGAPSQRDPGLRNYPQSDADVRAIAAELWGATNGETRQESRFGRGRVIRGKPVRAVLAADGVEPDFTFDAAAGSLDFIHRTADGAEIYFVVNRNARTDVVACTFRVAGLQPELWDPVTGARRDATEFTTTATTTTVSLRFAPHQSWFVVFRQPLRPSATQVPNFAATTVVQTLRGAWSVRFDPQWGGPAEVEFPSLTDWTLSLDEGIRFYSGTATYLKRFHLEASPAAGERWLLDLGRVHNLAEVRLNGVKLGVVWTAPWQIDLGTALRAGENQLEIDVVNLWPNRLIGDKYLPAAQKLTRTNIPLKDDARLLPSGLLGPVSLLREQ